MDLSRYKAYIFDFDYTLCDATPGIVRSFNTAFRNFGLPEHCEAEIRKTVGLTVADSFMIMTGSDDRELAKRFYAEFIRAADEVMTANTVYLPGARELLRRLLGACKPRAVVTTKLARRITDFFEKRGEPELIDFVIGYDEVKAQKPAPDGLLAACDRFWRDYTIKKADVVYVGDNIVDAQAAQAAGVDFIGAASGTTLSSALQEYPHVAVINGVAELLLSLH
jgi:haloacid dehalogenase superfamily, subfamily IA, variant 1 with third motif having Dx(3-4)D or Dx(3-4)E